MTSFQSSVLAFGILTTCLPGCGASYGGKHDLPGTPTATTRPVVSKEISLFDGKTLNGWEGDTSIWKVKDGIITGEEDSTSSGLAQVASFPVRRALGLSEISSASAFGRRGGGDLPG